MDIIYRYDPFAPLSQPKTPDAAAAIARLVEGNDRFALIVQRRQLKYQGLKPGFLYAG